jgi:hypothetical protein
VRCHFSRVNPHLDSVNSHPDPVTPPPALEYSTLARKTSTFAGKPALHKESLGDWPVRHRTESGSDRPKIYCKNLVSEPKFSLGQSLPPPAPIVEALFVQSPANLRDSLIDRPSQPF